MDNINSKKIMMDILPKNSDSKAGNAPEKKKDFFEKLSDARKNKEKTIISEKEKNKKRGKNKPTYFLIGIFVFFALSAVYFMKPASGAVVKIKPMSKQVPVNIFLRASSEGGEISFRLAVKDMEKEKKITASGFEKSEKKAEGTIVIYNGFSPSSQTLIKSTRFEASNGKIYRIDKTISVPGTKVAAGKIIAGSAETIVYADSPGEEYNLEFSDFTIPGLKGTAKYGKIYARSKTQIYGGYAGNVPKVDAFNLENESSKLRAEIEKEIFESAVSEISDNEVLFKDGTEINFEPKRVMPENADNSAVLKETGKFAAAVFSREDITSYLVNKYLKNTEFKDESYIKNFENLNFKITKKDFLNRQIILKIEGDAIFVKKINEEKLKEELVKTRNKEELFRSRPEIEEAKIILSPQWKKRLPKDYSKIKVEIE